MYKKTGLGFTLLALFLALCIWLLTSTEFNLGIDLKGGTELRYGLDLSGIPDDPNAVANEVKDIIARRLDTYGLKEIRIAIEGQDQMVVTLPGGDEESTDSIITLVEQAGNLAFQLVAEGAQHRGKLDQYRADEQAYLAKKAAWATEMRSWNERKAANPNLQEPAPVEPRAPLFLVRPEMQKEDPDPNNPSARTSWKKVGDLVLDNRPENIVPGSLIDAAGATIDPETQSPAVSFTMKGEGATRMGELTGKNIDRRMAILLDDQIIQAPGIRSRITDSGQITGGYTQKEVQSLVTILRGGSLPTKPQLLSKNSVGSVFGKKSIQNGLYSMLIGLLVVMVAITIYYLFGGLITNFALAFNTTVVLAFVVCFRQTLTLPGIAGILLTIGMAVDANILIFERVREERKRGKSLMQALTTGYQRAFSVIFDSNLTTLITGIVLLNFGTGPIKGFAVTLIAGILISFFSALVVTRLLLSFALNVGLLKQLKMLQAFDTPKIKFTRLQKPFMVVSTLVIIATWVILLPRGKQNYGIDFTGGARVAMSLAKPVPLAEMREKISGLADKHPDLFRDWSLQEVLDEGHNSFVLLSRVQPQDVDEGDGGAAEEKGVGTTWSIFPSAWAQETAPAAASATPTVLGGMSAAGDEAQLVRQVLEKQLSADDLLLPAPFGEFNWSDLGTTSTPSFTVNIRSTQGEVTKEGLRDLLNGALAEHPVFRADTEKGFDGIRVDSIDLLQGRTEAVPVDQYRITLSSYAPPLPSDVENPAPSKARVETAMRSVFQGDTVASKMTLSEPFPTVSTVGPVVASDLQGKAIIAFFISILGIIFYVSLRFEFIFGLAAIAALIHDVLITIGILAATDALFGDTMPLKINLPEVAALLTVIGYSINDTIVVFDRIRENLKLQGTKKLTFAEISDLSINQTLSRTLWTSVTTLITVGCLLFFGGEAVRGFSFVLFVGLIVGTYSSVFVASPVLIMLHGRSERRREALATQKA